MTTTEERLDQIEQRLSEMDRKLERLIELLEDKVTKNCEKMGEHIDFVETVYENVKHPLNYVCNQMNAFIGYEDNNPLLEIEDRNE